MTDWLELLDELDGMDQDERDLDTGLPGTESSGECPTSPLGSPGTEQGSPE
jgi:hypothetical protein